MPQKLTNTPKFNLKVATSEVHEKKQQGVLFFVLPPLLVLGIFVYCHMKTPKEASVQASPPVQKVHYSTTAQPISDDEPDEEEEGEEEEKGETDE